MKLFQRSIRNGIYHSKFEYELHNTILKEYKFHKMSVDYVSSHSYTPDFTIKTNNIQVLIEAKGFFRNSAESRKYVDIRKALKKNEILVFIFQDCETRMPFSRRRKDGSFFNQREWANKNNFLFLDNKREGNKEWKALLDSLSQ